MAVCDRLETQLTTTETESRRLLEAVFRQALTPPPMRVSKQEETQFTIGA
jgi:hypothetical protein